MTTIQLHASVTIMKEKYLFTRSSCIVVDPSCCSPRAIYDKKVLEFRNALWTFLSELIINKLKFIPIFIEGVYISKIPK